LFLKSEKKISDEKARMLEVVVLDVVVVVVFAFILKWAVV